MRISDWRSDVCSSDLTRLRNAARSGTLQKESALTRGLPASLDQLATVLHALQRHGFAGRSGGRWFLARDLTAASLNDLLVALDLALEIGSASCRERVCQYV